MTKAPRTKKEAREQIDELIKNMTAFKPDVKFDAARQSANLEILEELKAKFIQYPMLRFSQVVSGIPFNEEPQETLRKLNGRK